ncbi:MAG: hypothetical protein RL641_279 [Candidatus Parcubacteria bacterium]|jgi:hypothetical protein
MLQYRKSKINKNHMKKLTAIVSLVISANILSASASEPANADTSKPTPAQWTDISLFHINRLDAKNSTPLIWFNHENGDYFLEARINFDWSNTAGLFLGKTFSRSKKFWITPKLGMLFAGRSSDGYNGFSPEFNFGGNIGSFEYFTMNQHTIAVDDKPDFVYQYTEARFKCLHNHLAICYAIQFYKEQRAGAEW